MKDLKLLVVGHGRHGKDTVSEYLQKKYGLTFASSSYVCAEKVIFPVLAPLYGYWSVLECFDDRQNHRSEWYDLIHAYNEQDHSKLGREIFSSYNIYCGLRNAKEMLAMKIKNVYDCAIWVDRSEHLPPEDSSSMTITPDMCDVIIDNNGTLEDLYRNVDELMSKINQN